MAYPPESDHQTSEHPVLEIEFFHDVLCAWCFALSPRMRQLVSQYPEVRVIHRAFALAPTPESLVSMFGSKEQAKREILSHWRAANENDDARRINADLMAAQPFDYPHSMPGLLACKAAERQGGQEAHWAMYDRVQKAHLTECQDITDMSVLRRCAADVGLDVEQWEEDYHVPDVREAVERDIRHARFYGITSVPTLVADQKYALSGAQPYARLAAWIEQLLEKRTPPSL
ncbi:MAG: DSBA oxidoreductase [Candidatus Carbobacillus altaicus]|uniref:DSBA oxidoreductase n=1 Tax=Candidatus Carbonibacillus altaicus TaxID=2163959 RepID=A0A2R6XX66_9BACL|nr:MAG: DSBA oxidoreductase [Candidatus Carbobacillus altaicus]